MDFIVRDGGLGLYLILQSRLNCVSFARMSAEDIEASVLRMVTKVMSFGHRYVLDEEGKRNCLLDGWAESLDGKESSSCLLVGCTVYSGSIGFRAELPKGWMSRNALDTRYVIGHSGPL